ncbi:hypothetical protein UNDYM_3966 [Undibacterium sp. YM2]|uniref:hypothetical protein n=1 Tax=Undibacterium sp. YM2 TaxID=2058625 RepID=UPI001331F24F|nr:hypothetical protein [Undibacterium sp. YM2]BBB68219.1 hypothetical protein UNDYM_3966 [Undibacterium sp. YM2]
MRTYLIMHLTARILIGCVIGSVFYTPAYAGTFLSACTSRTNDLACALFVSRISGAAVRTKPDEMAEVSSRLAIGQIVRINWKLSKTAKSQWVYVGIKSDGLNDISPQGWVRAQDLAGESDFREVINCWPFASIFDESQVDGPVLDVKFSRDGKSDSGNIKVWSLGNLIRIGVSRRDSLVYAYDPETYRLTHAGSEESDLNVSLFDPPLLPGCVRIQVRR